MSDLISREAAIKAITEAYEDTDAEYILRKIPSAERWIPVSERLPKVGETVLLACKEIGFNCCEYMSTKIGIYNTNCGNIIAWMPLPEPYKGGRMMNDLISREAAIKAITVNGC